MSEEARNKMNENECLWVEFNDVGNIKKCPYEAIENIEPKNRKKRNKFYENYCSKCLKGQKINALREIAFQLKKLQNGGR